VTDGSMRGEIHPWEDDATTVMSIAWRQCSVDLHVPATWTMRPCPRSNGRVTEEQRAVSIPEGTDVGTEASPAAGVATTSGIGMASMLLDRRRANGGSRQGG
jgi:hypothetical protein